MGWQPEPTADGWWWVRCVGYEFGPNMPTLVVRVWSVGGLRFAAVAADGLHLMPTPTCDAVFSFAMWHGPIAPPASDG